MISASNDEQTLVSVHAQDQSSTVNITPLTNLIAARLSTSGDPAKIADELKNNVALFDKVKVDTFVSDLVAALKPAADAAGSTINPLNGVFAPNGIGHDKLLDALQVSVRPDGAGSNIEVTVRAAGATDGAAAPAVNLRNNAATTPVLPAVSGASLPVDGTPQLVTDLVTRLQACYAIPAADRVTAIVNSGLASTETIKAAGCKSLFINNDPAQYLNNGSTVGSNRGANSFTGIFRDGGTGIVFDRGQFEYRRANGDYVLTYRWIDPTGTNTDNDQVVARNVGGKLMLVGNQYDYNADIRAFVQFRDLINQTDSSYLSTGYNITVKNRTDNLGNPVFSRVIVTGPNGNTFTLVPSAALSNLVLQKTVNMVTTNSVTSVVRLAAQYTNPATTGNPAEKEASLVFAPTQLSDTLIAAIPDHGVWKFTFVHSDMTKTNVEQFYKTTSRAPTIGEAKQIQFSQLSADYRASLQSISATTGRVVFGQAAGANRVYVNGSAGSAGWVVPVGAQAPISLTVYGRAPDGATRFDDTLSFPSAVRKAQINCSRQTAMDLHCDATDPSQFATGSFYNSIELFARSNRQVGISSMFATYKF